MAMADNNALFQILIVEDKLDATSYRLWSYMTCHVPIYTIKLVQKNARNVVDDVGIGTT